MENTTYFSPGKKPLFNFLKKKKKNDEVNNSDGDSSMKDTKILKLGNKKFNANKPKNNKLLKTVGAGSGIFLVVAGIIAIVVFLVVVKPAYAVFDVLRDLRTDTQDLNDALVKRDMIVFNETLDRTEKDLDRVAEARDNNFSWAYKFPMTSGYVTDTDHFIAAGKHAITAAREFSILVEPFAEAAGLNVEVDPNLPRGYSGLAEAFASWIAVMPDVAANMDGVIVELAAIGDELKSVDASKYPENFFGQPLRALISGAQGSLANIDEYGPDLKLALELIPGLVGVGNYEQRYAIIMQNNKEIRATGGFWTNYATFKVADGLLSSDFTSKDMYSIDFLLDQIDAYHTFPTVPEKYATYLKVERMFARDANISPDFPTAIDQWNYFYDLGNQIAPWEVKPVSGVIAIDTQVVKELLEVTGPVTVNGVTFGSDNVVLELEMIASLSLAEQSNRKKVLGDLMEGMLINVFESDNNLWPKLVDKGVDLLRRKHILVVLYDVDAQALVEKYNLAGRIVDPVEGDYAYAVQTNLGGDKTNLFVTKEVTHKLEKDNGRWMRTVDIEYTYKPKGGDYAVLEKRFQDWMRLYVPLGSELISVEGSQDVATTSEEHNKTVFDGFIALGPNETKTMTFKYYLPDSAVSGDMYSLYVQKQPGLDAEVHNVVVKGKKQTEEVNMDTTFTSEL
jgi:hypothetical protein